MAPVVYIGVPPRKLAEIMAALYGLCMGIYSGLAWSGGANIFGWISTDVRIGGHLAYAFTGAAILHAIGVRINGDWRWSPVLRFIGMTVHTALILFLAVSALRLEWSSASVTYPFVLVLFVVGLFGAWKDSVRAYHNRGQDWSL